jgi:replicative DNA helicase
MSDDPPIDVYDPPSGGGRASFPNESAAEGLPSSVHTEIAVLGACLLQEEAINDALEALVAEDFSLDSHQRIFRAISELAETGNNVDYLTLQNELSRRRELDAIGGPAYLAFLTEGIPRNFNVQSYCAIVKQKAVLRQLMGIGHDLTVKASDQSEDPYALLEATEELILELSQSGQSQGFSTLLDSVQEAGGVESFVGKMYDPALMTGLSMGFVDVDKVLGGLQKKELTIVAARPSQGKSAYVLCVAINVSLADPEAVVAFFSVEMSKIALHKRLLAVMAGVNTRKAAEGWLSREERIRLGSAVVKAGDWNLEIDDSSMLTVTQMRAKSRRLKKQKGRLDLVIVDYLQLLQGTKRYNNREQEVASISRGLKALAKELDVPVMAVAMVGRGSERHGDKRPMLSDLRESGQIEGDADVILFIHRESYYHSEDDPDAEQGIAEILIAKNREGATGTRKLAYQAEYTRFSNLAVERY